MDSLVTQTRREKLKHWETTVSCRSSEAPVDLTQAEPRVWNSLVPNGSNKIMQRCHFSLASLALMSRFFLDSLWAVHSKSEINHIFGEYYYLTLILESNHGPSWTVRSAILMIKKCYNTGAKGYLKLKQAVKQRS